MANNQNNTSNMGQDFSDEDQRGQNQGKENNPGNFANDREKASEAGKKGGQSSGGNTDNLNNQ